MIQQDQVMTASCNLLQEAKHADGCTLAMIGQAAKHPEKARVMLRLRLFKPVSPKERSASTAASMSREAKLLPTVLPIEATPTGQHATCTLLLGQGTPLHSLQPADACLLHHCLSCSAFVTVVLQ